MLENTNQLKQPLTGTACYHCGEPCRNKPVVFDDKYFCCEGCQVVYDLLKENNLCTYYTLETGPGVAQKEKITPGKFAYLDEPVVSSKIIRFRNNQETHVTFFVPGIHCSSCIWLLENMHRLHKGIHSSTVNFLRKEVSVVFNAADIRLSAVAELMARIGYEPLVSLDDLEQKIKKTGNRKEIIKIGLAGFCFGNIMMLSFPDYFASGTFNNDKNLSVFFSWLNLTLSLPVFFYCASGFFHSAWKSIRHGYLNIDAPIALAILVTFGRSVYEIVSQTGTGYMDSMSGIVFFMLIGRFFQNRTNETLSFERDYKSFFPVGVSVKTANGKHINQPVSSLKKGDVIIIRNNELIPADSMLQNEQTHIDYSFITGESSPVKKLEGELIYAGGKQLDGAIELKVVNPVNQSYLTRLWNDEHKEKDTSQSGFTDKINKYFTAGVLMLALGSAVFWYFADTTKALNAFTAVLIVACPCGLLLASTFANGNVMRIFGRNRFYLKNAGVIEKLAKTDAICFDKTGTITHGSEIVFVGKELHAYEEQLAVSLASHSSHPLSRKIQENFGKGIILPVDLFKEIPGHGLKGIVDAHYVMLGSDYFVTGRSIATNATSKVFFMIDGKLIGYFGFSNAYRPGLKKLFHELRKHYSLKLLSGDNDAEKQKVAALAGHETELLFNLKPEDKFKQVNAWQAAGKRVAMIGDGLNDAIALKQSYAGIAVSDNTNNFSPACDAIVQGSELTKLPSFFKLAKGCKNVIVTTFAISLIYNITGLLFALSGTLSPVVAAILMPASSVTIVLLATGLTTLLAKKNRL